MKASLQFIGLLLHLGGGRSPRQARPIEENQPHDPLVDESAPTPGCRWNFLALRELDYQLSPSTFTGLARLRIRRPRFIKQAR